jgi:hypothetical protein
MEVIAENPDARALRICGLDQAALERLVTVYGSQFPAILFDGNQRATQLWDSPVPLA